MNSEGLKNLLDKIPIAAIAFVYLLYLGFDWYSFENAADSPLQQKKARVSAIDSEIAALQGQLKKAEDFYRSLDTKREQIRALSSQLGGMKETLSDDIDSARFIKQIVTEAERVGLSVKSIRPAEIKQEEFYYEYPFNLVVRGVFVQLIVFVDRVSSLQRITRIDDFSIKPIGPATAKYVEIEAQLKVKTYRYNRSKADEITVAAEGGGS